MRAVTLDATFESWQEAARGLLRRAVQPRDVVWREKHAPQPPLAGLVPAGADDLSLPPERQSGVRLMVPRRFLAAARWVAAHRDPDRWDVLYRVLWRILHENRNLLDNALDRDVEPFQTMFVQTRRDEHKMRAFVRFRKVDGDAGPHYVAFHRPDHHIVRLAAPFFAGRFASMRWSILTPDECAHWDGDRLTFSPGVGPGAAPDDDEIEELWRTYYASVFNPARVNLRAMRAEMPVRHWRTLPETRMLPALLEQASARVRGFQESADGSSARSFVPEGAALPTLAAAAQGCRGCELYQRATRAVFGEGPADARIVCVGEQPGDEEDRTGRPFVGPAGEVFDRALAAGGLDRSAIYVTNAVKHFKWEPRGKRRIHQTPRLSEMRACRPWLEAELQRIRPLVVVALGGTAGRALFGPQFRVMKERGRVIESAWAEAALATIHPSAVLRAADSQSAEQYFRWLVEDLRLAAATAASRSGRRSDGILAHP